MKDFELFYNAANELDILVEDGMFGPFAADLLQQRDSVDTTTYCYNGLLDMFRETQYGIENVIGIIFRLLKLYTDALNVSPQEPVDVLTAFLKGTKEHPELECLSSFTEFFCVNATYRDVLKELGHKPNATNSEVKRLASSLLATYSKGVELVGKSFTQLLTLAQIVKDKQYDLYENSLLSIYEKTKQFKGLVNNEYIDLADVIDRKVRNAEAHLNSYFSIEKRCYVMKQNSKQGKTSRTEVFEISAEDMILRIFSKVCWFVQGYIASCILLVLVYEDKRKYNDAVKYILRLK